MYSFWQRIKKKIYEKRFCPQHCSSDPQYVWKTGSHRVSLKSPQSLLSPPSSIFNCLYPPLPQSLLLLLPFSLNEYKNCYAHKHIYAHMHSHTLLRARGNVKHGVEFFQQKLSLRLGSFGSVCSQLRWRHILCTHSHDFLRNNQTLISSKPEPFGALSEFG